MENKHFLVLYMIHSISHYSLLLVLFVLYEKEENNTDKEKGKLESLEGKVSLALFVWRINLHHCDIPGYFVCCLVVLTVEEEM